MDEFLLPIPELIKGMAGSPVPTSEEVSAWMLENERKIYLDFDVGGDLVGLQQLILRWNMEDRGKPAAERRPIWIYIMSYGGDMEYMWMFIDAILCSVTPVYTVNLGISGSAAAIIFIAGHKRFMMPLSKIVIHEGSAQLSGDAVKVMDQSEAYKKQLKQMKEFIITRTRIPRTQLMKKRNNDWELDSAYCLENGVCDVVVENIEEVI